MTYWKEGLYNMPKVLKNIQPQKLLAFGVLVILYVIFAIFGRNYFSVDMAIVILSSAYWIGFLAIGVTFVIITGGIDLSIGTSMVCSAIIGGMLFRDFGVPLWICLIIVVLIGTVIGIINGLLVTRLKLPPFIATLGIMMVSRGFGSIITGTSAKTYPSMHDVGGSWFSNVFLRVGSFPVGAIWLLAYFLLAFIVLNKTKLGRYIFAIGSNEEAVRLSGVNVANWKCAAYAISGFSMGVGAIFYAALATTINPGTGNGFELEAIAGVIIGGTSLSGGVGSVTGTMIGVFIMAILKTGLSSMNLPAPFQLFFTGLVVIGAVWLDMYRVKKANEVRKA